MGSVNKVILVGNLGQDPKTSTGPSGKTVCRFSLATTDKFGGEERTEWHNIVLFDRPAEIADKYLSKGRQAYIAAPPARITNRPPAPRPLPARPRPGLRPGRPPRARTPSAMRTTPSPSRPRKTICPFRAPPVRGRRYVKPACF